MKLGSRIPAIAAVIIALCAQSGFAATQTVSVSGNVVGDCTTAPASGQLQFGAYSPTSASDLAPSTPFQFSINCTRGDTNLSVAVDGGLNYANATPFGDRAMIDGSGKYLTYQLYEDGAHATAWPFATSGGAGSPVTLTAGGILSANTIALYGVIPHGQIAADAGTYSDTIHVTVNY
jgi:spore coat protein U-like protein